MASSKGPRGGNGDKTAPAANRNEEGKRSVTELSRLFNQRREGLVPVPKTPQETKRSSAVVDWMTKGNIASPAKKPSTPVARRPATPADPNLVIARLEKAEAELELTKSELVTLRQNKSEMRKEAESAIADKTNAEIQRGAAAAQLEVVKRETDAKVRSLQELLSNTEIREKQAISNAEALKAAHVEALSSRHKSQQNAEQGSTAYKAMVDKLSALESQNEYAKKETTDLEVVLKRNREVLKNAQAEVAQTTSRLADKNVEIAKLRGEVQEGRDKVAAAKKAEDSAEREAEDLKVSVVLANAAKNESIALVEVAKAETSTARHEADMAQRMADESARRLEAAHVEVEEANGNMSRLMRDLGKMKMEAATGAAASAAAGAAVGAEAERLQTVVAEAKAAALTAGSRHEALQKQNQVAVTSESMAKAQAAEARAALAKAGLSIAELQKEVEAGRKRAKDAETVAELKEAAAAAQVKAAQAAEQESGDKVRAAVEAEAAEKAVTERLKKTEQELRTQIQVAKEGSEKARAELEESEGRQSAARGERDKDAKAREAVGGTNGVLLKAQEGEERASTLQAEVQAARSKEQAARAELVISKEGEQQAKAELEAVRSAAESLVAQVGALKREVSGAMGAAATAERRYEAAQLELDAALSAERRAVAHVEEAKAGGEQAVAALAAAEAQMKRREEEVRQSGVGEVEVATKKAAAAQAQLEAAKAEGQEWKKRMEAAVAAVGVAEEAGCAVKAELRGREEREGEGRKAVERLSAEKESALREAEGAVAALATADSRYKAVLMELQSGKGSEGAVRGSVHGLAEKKVAAAEAAERESEGKLQAALMQAAAAKAAQQASATSCHSLQTTLDAVSVQHERLQKEVGELRGEVAAAKSDSSSAEKKLRAAVAALEASEAGEEAALKSMRLRATSDPAGDRSECEALQRQVREAEVLAEMRVAAANAEVEAARMGEREEQSKLEAALAQLAAAKDASQAAAREGGRDGSGREEQAARAAKVTAELEAARNEAKATKRGAEDLEWKLKALLGTKEALEGELSKWREEAVVRRLSAAALSAQQAEREEAGRKREIRMSMEAGTELGGEKGSTGRTAEIEEVEPLKAAPVSKANGGGGAAAAVPYAPPSQKDGVVVGAVPSATGKEGAAMREVEQQPTCGCVIQ